MPRRGQSPCSTDSLGGVGAGNSVRHLKLERTYVRPAVALNVALPRRRAMVSIRVSRSA